MKAMLVTALCLSSVLTGCAGLPTQYHVTVDSSTTSPAVQQAVLDAVEEWRSHVLALGIDEHVGPCTVGKGYGEVCVVSVPGIPDDDTIEATTFETPAVVWYTDGATTKLYPDNFRDDVAYRVVEHELGHAMGLVHTGDGTLMCAHPSCSTLGVTGADIQQWENLRR